MYRFVGSRVPTSQGKVEDWTKFTKDDGHRYVVYNDRFIPDYPSNVNDPLERGQFLDDCMRRFLRHCEPFINTKRSDAQIGQMKAEYESLPAGDERKRITGAILVGTVVERCHEVCKKLIKAHKDIKELEAESKPVPDKLRRKTEKNEDLLKDYFLLLTDKELMKCPRLRDTSGAIALDADTIFFEAVSEVVKASSTKSEEFLFQRSRGMKVVRAMEAIEKLTDDFKSYFAEARNADAINAALDKFAEHSKVRAAVRGSDVKNYEESVINYTVAKDRLMKILGTPRQEKMQRLQDDYITVVENMIDLREDLPKSCEALSARIQAAKQWVLGT